MRKKVPEKRKPAETAADRKTQSGIAMADRAFVLAMGDSFSKTTFRQRYHEAFGVTLTAAAAVFESLLEKQAIVLVVSLRHYTRGPAIESCFQLVRLEGNRTGEFKYKSLTQVDQVAGIGKCLNPKKSLLPGDVVFGRLDPAEGVLVPYLLVSRAKTEVVCKIGYANEVCVEGCNSVIAGLAAETNVKALRNQFFTVRLDADCLRNFSPLQPLTGALGQKIGDKDCTQTEIDMTLARLGIPNAFSDEALAQAQAYPDAVESDKEVADRVDLRDIAFVTIDGEDARDFDDAVWCAPLAEARDGWRLLVAIADVSHYVEAQSALDADAQQRGTSVYFPTRVVPMLPEKLSNGLCSLNPGVDRCALVCDMLVSAQGDVTAYQFYPALICSKARLTYTSVWSALQGDVQDLLLRGGSLADIRRLYALFKSLQLARRRRGAVDFESAETEMVTDAQTNKIIAIRKREHNDAHRLIEECMLAANVCAADFVNAHKAGCLYRVHDAPAADRLASLRSALQPFGLKLAGGDNPTAADYVELADKARALPTADVVHMLLLRSMQRAVYSPVLKPHFGLNFEAYTHFTSPIRRYPDLLVHRTIRAILASQRYVPVLVKEPEEEMMTRMSELAGRQKFSEKSGQRAAGTRSEKKNIESMTWEALGLLTSAAERRADEASRDVVAWMKADYISKYRRKCFEGVITGANHAGVYVTLTGVFVEGFVHVSRLSTWEFFYYDEDKMFFEGESGGERFMIGDKVTVRVYDANTDTRRIDFEMVKNHTDATRGRGKKNKKSKRRF